jgi:hypothetical protein
MIWKRFGRKQWQPKQGIILTSAWTKIPKAQNASQTGYSSILVKIQINNLPNTKPEEYHYTSLINNAMLILKHFQTTFIFKIVMLFLHPDTTFTITSFMLWKTTVTSPILIFLGSDIPL